MALLQLPDWPNVTIVFANYRRFQAGECIIQPIVLSRMFLWCESGEGIVSAGSRTIRMSSGMSCWLPWGWDRRYEAAPDHPFKLGGVHLIPDHQPGIAVRREVAHHAQSPLAGDPMRRDRAGLETVEVRRMGTDAPIWLLARYLVSRFRSSGASDDWLRKAGMLFLQELVHFLQAEPGRFNPRLEAMMRYLEKRFPHFGSLEAMAAEFQVSPATIERLFRRELGIGPKAYGSRLALREASRLLQETSLPVGQVGSRVGYPDPYYFSKWFKRMSGLRPTAWRARFGTGI